MEGGKLKLSVYDRSLAKPRTEVSLSAFAFVFSEVVDYCLKKVNAMHELEERLHELGVPVGQRALELYGYRENKNRRETRLLPMMNFVTQTVWKNLFGHHAELLKGQDHENEYMLYDKALLVNRFVTIPRDFGAVDCGAYVAGVVEGVLCSAGFPAATSAHSQEESTGGGTTILVRFEESVLARERKLAG
jgi:hypothetical protein|eukprot:TRINITY_DN74561_c0_g1_i1.p1 TRINITY_DN74561_c0_g1~~TRINITY_DN74561_c0_g1_i1.p1  ORF type:complete len:190 (-),score=30.72 TRINITY_DN74561_c0_g1_i1:133-702(-)